jgi:hypothetical protein
VAGRAGRLICVMPLISVKIPGQMTQLMRIHASVARVRSMLAAGPVAVLILTAEGCDPVINIGGANFPGWLLCAIVGIVLAGLLRPLFAAAGIESYMGPALVIYPCLVLLLGCLTWLIFFNRV